MAKTKADKYSAETTESEECNVYEKDTVGTPHQISLIYPTNLEPGVIDAFNIEPKTKCIRESLTIQRREDADVSLTDAQYPRDFIQMQLRNVNGDVVCVIKNASERRGKAIKLKYPNQFSTLIECKNEDTLSDKSVTVSSLNLVFHCNIIPGDINALKYTLTTIPLQGEIFNQQFLASTSIPRSLSREYPSVAYYPDSDQTVPKRVSTTNDLSGRQHLLQVQYPYNNCLPTGYNIDPTLSSLSNAFCNLCSTDYNQSIHCPPQTRSPNCQCRFPGDRFDPAHFHTTTTAQGLRQSAMHHMPMTVQGTSGIYPHQTMNVLPSYRQPMQPQYQGASGMHSHQTMNIHHSYRHPMQTQCNDDVCQSRNNWHSVHPNSSLPSGPDIGMIPGPHNTVNTHPIQQQSSHDFNPNLISEYTSKDKDWNY